MKWRILLRYLAILILSVVLVVLINAYLTFKITDYGLWSTTSRLVLDFHRYVTLDGGKPAVAPAGLEILERHRAWIQILDEEGYEIYSWHKPQGVPEHYAPSEMVFYNIYAGAVDGYTSFCGTAIREGYQWSYIIGFPVEMVAKYLLVYSPQALRSYFWVMLATFLVVPVLVFLVMGYIFGRSLSDPVLQIIDGIQQLARSRYERRWPEKGVYREVYRSLNHLAETLKQNEIERQKTEQMREEWIQNLSHDLKTPLASIKGYGELLADGRYRFTDGEIQSYAGIIKRKAEYLEELLEDLKLTQTLKRGLVPLHRRPEDLVALLREIAIDVLNNPRYEKRKIFFHPQQETIIFPVDNPLMQRAFANLIYNALVHNREDTEIHISIAQKDRIQVRIQDNGKGIPPEELEKLFERYYRGTNTEENHQGSGLGMAIAKQIIERHGGSIAVDSALGAGTTVLVTL